MQVDLIGRTHNIALLSQTESLTYSKTLFPLFEATGNSIYNIKVVEDSACGTDIPNRHIDIYIVRENRQIEFAVGTQDIRPNKKFKIYNSTNKISEIAEDAKLITDAKKRNQVLFDKLLLPKK